MFERENRPHAAFAFSGFGEISTWLYTNSYIKHDVFVLNVAGIYLNIIKILLSRMNKSHSRFHEEVNSDQHEQTEATKEFYKAESQGRF